MLKNINQKRHDNILPLLGLADWDCSGHEHRLFHESNSIVAQRQKPNAIPCCMRFNYSVIGFSTRIGEFMRCRLICVFNLKSHKNIPLFLKTYILQFYCFVKQIINKLFGIFFIFNKFESFFLFEDVMNDCCNQRDYAMDDVVVMTRWCGNATLCTAKVYLDSIFHYHNILKINKLWNIL